ncbi:MAG: gamma-glutamyl-phosphate reductase, partial [Deltaproteobacteria bacterium]|nr:gamma-glutamyl-phosphate reductase [Deltaproteobacteria bacterium]
MSIEETIKTMAQRAKQAAKQMSVLNTSQKNDALERIAEKPVREADTIKQENEKDLADGR